MNKVPSVEVYESQLLLNIIELGMACHDVEHNCKGFNFTLGRYSKTILTEDEHEGYLLVTTKSPHSSATPKPQL